MPYLKEVNGDLRQQTRGKTVRGTDKQVSASSHTNWARSFASVSPSIFSFFIMATRSRIGIQLKDDSILSVYCHYDGYPEFNGRVLREHYNTSEKVADLIDGGNILPAQMQVGRMKLWKSVVPCTTLPVENPWREDMMKASLIFLKRSKSSQMLDGF